MDAPPPSVILVETKFFFLQWVFAFFTPRISIDGWPPVPLKWGIHAFTVPPGAHHVDVCVPYFFYKRMGANSIDFQVGPGDVAQVTWNAPWITFLPGSMRTAYLPGAAVNYPGAMPLGWQPAGLNPAQPMPQMSYLAAPTAAGGWFPDPAARHELRYYDGATWTPAVSDAGVSAHDPI